MCIVPITHWKILAFTGTRADERTDVILHHLVEQRFFGLAAFVLDGSMHAVQWTRFANGVCAVSQIEFESVCDNL
jgi:hypothetical protein